MADGLQSGCIVNLICTQYKLVCIDIDGTLLDDNHQLLPDVKKSLRDAAQKGLRIVLGSGRMPAGVELIEKKLGIDCIKMCNAGTYILDGERCISAAHLSIDSMRSIYHRYAQEWEIPLWIFEGRDWYVTDEDLFTKREAAIILHQPTVVDLEELADCWQRDGKRPNKLLFASNAEVELCVEGEKEQEEAAALEAFIKENI